MILLKFTRDIVYMKLTRNRVYFMLLINFFKSELKNKKTQQSLIAYPLTLKYKNISNLMKRDDYIPDEKLLEEVSKDVSETINSCGHPTFISCLLLDFLTWIFNSYYGNITLRLPEKCYSSTQ